MGRIAYADLVEETSQKVTYQIRRYPQDPPHTQVTLSGENWETWEETGQTKLSADASSIAHKARKLMRENGKWPQRFGYYS